MDAKLRPCVGRRSCEKPLISIIVPVHNAADALERAVLSILGAGEPDVEIVLVENFSSDCSWEVCCLLAARYPETVVALRSFRRGVSAARNEGLMVARGEIIGFCDADDAYSANALHQVRVLLEQGGYHLVTTAFRSYGRDGKGVPMCVEAQEDCSGRLLQEYMMFRDCIMGSVWNKFFRKELLDGIRFDEKLTHCEDMHFVSQVLSRFPNAKVHISPFISYEYYMNPSSATRDYNRLLDECGNLRYVVALDAIALLYPGDGEMRLYIRSGQFRLIEENIDLFLEQPHVVRKLARTAMKFAFAFIMCRRRYPLRQRVERLLHVLQRMLYRLKDA